MPLYDPTDPTPTFGAWWFGSGEKPKPDTKLGRVTIHVPDRDLATTRVRGVGYRQTSPCGRFTARGKTVRDVRAAVREHRASCAICLQLAVPATKPEPEH